MQKLLCKDMFAAFTAEVCHMPESMQDNGSTRSAAAVHLWEASLEGNATTGPDTAEWPPYIVQLSAQDRQPTALGHIPSNSSSAHLAEAHPHPNPCKPLTQKMTTLAADRSRCVSILCQWNQGSSLQGSSCLRTVVFAALDIASNPATPCDNALIM